MIEAIYIILNYCNFQNKMFQKSRLRIIFASLRSKKVGYYYSSCNKYSNFLS